ncbi:helix-turn-helix transcriptional regulator [Streptomyces sp. SP18CS02]|uniref:helix-turn-helix transcriptional regulator n=1 Tax=Streptomyces sp. SP18CS02 TaxID=3002531 RepID=UPI002E76AF4C|nr:LuxR C-terminal-related transcriptional regulator [Streptomyces sp. SP18CS02]MEE1754575.1 LuxR C-terminal-related transcriptional regulator [Streptomyces sp. SP18CS02]
MTGKTISESPLRIYGRSAELDAVAGLTKRLRTGRGGALLFSGAPGLGRTALLAGAARGFTAGPVLSPRTAPAESRVPYSGAHALLCAAAGRMGTAPADVLRRGLAPGELLELLRGVSAGAPLLVCVDDVHLWDAPSRAALGFAARRPDFLGGTGLLLSVADHAVADADLSGVPVVRLGPLDDRASGALLDGLTGPGTDHAVREELLFEGEGNPALLVALAERLSPDQLRGRRPLPRPLAGSGALSAAFGDRLAPLPADTRLLLLLASAAHEPDPDGPGVDAAHVLRAARAAGLDPTALDPAEAAGVARTAGDRILFGSSLWRRTVYGGSPLSRRRAAHSLLASVIDADRHRLRHLLHLALSAEGPDCRLGAELTAAATSPDVRASGMERSVALARAAELTPHDDTRVARLTAAAEHARLSGRPRRARELLSGARDGAAHDAVRGRADLVRGALALRDGPVRDAHEALIMAAARLGPYDPGRAMAARLAAMDAAWAAGDAQGCLLALDGGAVPAAEGRAPAPVCPSPPAPPTAGSSVPETPWFPPLSSVARSPFAPEALRSPLAPSTAAPWSPSVEDEANEYRKGLRTALDGRLLEAREPLRRVLDRARGDDEPTRLLRAGVAALVLGDIGSACHVNARALAVARSRGLDALVPQVLEHLAYAELRAGQHARARAHAQEGLRAAHRAGQRNVCAHLHAILAMVASVQDDAAAVASHADAAMETAGPHGLAQAATLAEWAVARADLCRGRAFEAAARLGPLVRPGARRGHFAVHMLAVPCFVEAAVASGEHAQARSAVEGFALWAAQGADPHAPAQLARCRALIAPPEETEALYAAALAGHELADGDFERARTQLLFGKWLRRRRRPGAAKSRLRDALVAFERGGARPWAEQTRAELRATGEAPAPLPTGGLARLTPQQLRIARCVASGATNREVALRLSVSPRTVDHHLRNVFALLGVRSRVELARLVDRAEEGGADL